MEQTQTRGKGTSRQWAPRIRGQARLYSPIPGYLSYPRVFSYSKVLWELQKENNFLLLNS